MGLFGGGNSSSSSSTTTNTYNTDRRQVVDAGSVGVSSDSSTVTINSLDAGAIDAGKMIALAGLGSNANNTAVLLETAAQLFSKSADLQSANVKLAGTLASGAADAYRDAGDQAQGNKSLIFAAIAVVGVAAFTMRRKG